MTIKLNAIYINGIFKPFGTLPLRENQAVSLEVTPLATIQVPTGDFASLYGIWKNVSADLDSVLDTVRQTTHEKLRRFIGNHG